MIDYQTLYEKANRALLKSEAEKLRLQARLKKYSRLLGITAKKSSLSDNEKQILYALVAHATYNDSQLAKEIGVKRSTATAIRNRLKKQKYYSEIYIPNLQALGAKALVVLYATYDQRTKELDDELGNLTKMPRFIGMLHTDNCFAALFATETIIGMQKELDARLNNWAKKRLFKEHPTVVVMPFELHKLRRFFDYAPLLNHLFEINKHTCNEDASINIGKAKLTKNTKDTLLTMVQHPEETTLEHAKRLRLSRTTVANIKKHLMRKGIVKKVIMPNIDKIACELIAFSHFRFSPGSTIEARSISASHTRREPHAILKISGDKDTIAMRLFTDYSEESELIDKAAGLYHRHGFLLDEPTVLRMVPSKTKKHGMDFKNITKHLLEKI